MRRRLSWIALVLGSAVLLAIVPHLSGEESSRHEGTSEVLFDPSQTYEVFFSLHPSEIDRLSNIRLLGLARLGPKIYLKFSALLNNQRQEGYLDLQTVSAIVPTTRPLITTPEVLLDRQPLDQRERIKEMREETIREIIKDDSGAVIAPAPSKRP